MTTRRRQSSPAERYERAVAVYRSTSAAAWDSVLDSLPDIDRRIVEVIHDEDGAISDWIEQRTGLKHQTVSAQIRHMVEAGLLVPSDERRPTRSGRKAIVWRLPAVPAARQVELFA